MKFFNQKDSIQIHYTSELPAKTGLDPSSFTVGLLNALYTLNNKKISTADVVVKQYLMEQELIKIVYCQDQSSVLVDFYL